MQILQAIDPTTGALASYVQLAKRTAAPLGGRMTVIHSMLGVSGELLEVYQLIRTHTLYVPDLLKEVGDVLWYYALLYDYASSEREFFADVESAMRRGLDDAEQTDEMQLVYCADRLTALLKKELCYYKTATVSDIFDLYRSALYVLVRLLQWHGISLQDVLNRNIEKLSKRFDKQRFDATQATSHNGQ